MTEAAWKLAPALLTLLMLAAPLAGAQAPSEPSQTATASASGSWSTIETLPAETVHPVTITTENPAPLCACTTTTITVAVEAPSGTEAAVDPAEYTIDWTSQPGEGSHTQALNLTAAVPEALYGQSVTFTVLPNGSTDNPAYGVSGVPANITLDLPDKPAPPANGEDTGDQDDPMEGPGSGNETGGNGSSSEDQATGPAAGTGSTDEETEDSPGPGALAALAAVALALLVARTRE